MKTISSKRRWLAFATVDAVLMMSAGSAMAAPQAMAGATLHFPAVLLTGLGLLGVSLTRRRAG